jgi:hypothetical protein
MFSENGPFPHTNSYDLSFPNTTAVNMKMSVSSSFQQLRRL